MDGVKEFRAINRNGRRAGLLHGGGMHNRIYELRTARGWSMRELATRLNTSASGVNNLEKGTTRLNTDWIEKLSKVFEVSPEELMGIVPPKPTGFEEDVSPYQGEDAHVRPKNAQFLFSVGSNVLDQIGIFAGGIIVVDMSPNEMSKIGSGDVVIAQAHDGAKTAMILRQFVEPSILITNSTTENKPILNIRMQDVVIKGVVVASHNRFRQPKSAGE